MMKTAVKRMVRFLFVYRTYLVVYYDLKNFSELQVNDNIKNNIREINISELSLFSKIADQKKINLYKKWFESGYRCMAYIENNTILSFLWFSTRDTHDQGDDIFMFVIPVAKGESYLFSWYTLPSKRKMGIMGAIIQKTLMELKEENILWVKWSFDKKNIAVQKIYKKIGCEIVGSIKLMQVVGIKRINLKAIKRPPIYL